MTAPENMKALQDKLDTGPWVFWDELKSYPPEQNKQVGQWIRSQVNAGTAIRFDQKWPGCKTEAAGKTVVGTAALAAAHHHKTTVRFGSVDYNVTYLKPEGAKYGTVWCSYKGESDTYPEAKRDFIFKAIQRRAVLAPNTQLEGQQTFEYHEGANQYLIMTPLSAKATKVFDTALAALVNPAPSEANPEPQTEPPLAPATPNTAYMQPQDPVAAQNVACKDCGAAITYATAKVRVVSPHQSDFICVQCEASGA